MPAIRGSLVHSVGIAVHTGLKDFSHLLQFRASPGAESRELPLISQVARNVPEFGCLYSQTGGSASQGAAMTPEGSQASGLMTANPTHTGGLQEYIGRAIQDLLASLPNPDQLSPDARRGRIARYTAVP